MAGPFYFVYHQLVSKNFPELALEVLSPEALCNDLSLRIDQYIIGDPIELKGLDGLAVPVFEVADMRPIQPVRPDRLLPGILFLVKGYAQDGEILAFEFIICLDDIGVLGPAGSAPACPEIDEQIFSLIGSKGNDPAAGIGKSKIRRRFPNPTVLVVLTFLLGHLRQLLIVVLF